ncbi:MAG: hypothetical protein P1U65_12370 [Minwuia sp.]|nr:hypothetical protein [Minwuia sp.]
MGSARDIDLTRFALQTLIRYLLGQTQFTLGELHERIRAHGDGFSREQVLNFLNRQASGRTHARHIETLRPVVLQIFDEMDLWSEPFLRELRDVLMPPVTSVAISRTQVAKSGPPSFGDWSDPSHVHSPYSDIVDGMWLLARVSTHFTSRQNDPEISLSFLDLSLPPDPNSRLKPFHHYLVGKFDRSLDVYDGWVLPDRERVNLLSTGAGAPGSRISLISGIARPPSKPGRRPVMRGQMRGYSYNRTPFAANFHAERLYCGVESYPGELEKKRQEMQRKCGVFKESDFDDKCSPIYWDLIRPLLEKSELGYLLTDL